MAKVGRVRRAWRRNGRIAFLRLCIYNLRLSLGGSGPRHSYVQDDAWDVAHGTDTSGVLEVDEIEASAEQKQGAVRYEATPPECFEHLIEQAGGRTLEASTFVDIGSGKGRVVLMAALAGFRKAIGVEMGSDLHGIANANLERLRPRLGEAEVHMLLADARDFSWEPEPTLLFLNNPFGAELLAQLLQAIETSLKASPRPFTIIYYHCNHGQLLKARSGWSLVAEGWWRDESHHYSIHRWMA
jgi:predicted RNA methylase